MKTALDVKFSPKQREVWRQSVDRHHRWCVSWGATRSGKTYLDYYKIPVRIRRASADGLILFLGNTKGTLERNVFDRMRQVWGTRFVGNVSSANKIRIFGREAYALGADKATQVSKLQGAGFSYVYGDELTTWNEDVFRMLQSRLDAPGAVCDLTLNPSHPNHWAKKFIDSDADIYQQHFHIDDNPYNDAAFVSALKQEYAGTVYYDRLILGRWVAAEGVVYRQYADNPSRFDATPEDADNVSFSIIGVDFGGTQSAHAFICTGFKHNMAGVTILDEYHSKAELSPDDLEREFVAFVKAQIAAGYNVLEVRCDSAEQVLIRGFRNALTRAGISVPVRNAKKTRITDRIQLTLMLMGAGRFTVSPHCEHLRRALQEAVYDSKKMDDVRLDDGTSNIDSLDAMEYSIEPYARQLADALMLRKAG